MCAFRDASQELNLSLCHIVCITSKSSDLVEEIAFTTRIVTVEDKIEVQNTQSVLVLRDDSDDEVHALPVNVYRVLNNLERLSCFSFVQLVDFTSKFELSQSRGHLVRVRIFVQLNQVVAVKWHIDFKTVHVAGAEHGVEQQKEVDPLELFEEFESLHVDAD